MKTSVALCTYNGEKFLPEQLDSIAKQTLLPDELVVCDDRSKDGTLKILEEFGESAPFPVHIHQNEINLGSTRNFEKAISLCQGDIIALCDQDDVWKPHKLERLAEVLQAHPEAGYVFSDAELVDENLRPLGRLLWDSVGFRGQVRELFGKGEQVPCFARQHIVTGATMAFRATVGKMAMPFPTDGYWIHDGWVALVSSATGHLGISIDESLIAYRQHSSQQIGAPDPATPMREKSLLGMYHDLKAHQQYLFTEWEKHCLHVLKLKDILKRMQERHPSPALDQNLKYFQEFETHFLARRKILTSKGPRRYGLILREVFSGRYAKFSDSWRSLFRDTFLRLSNG
jgi:glycosyltransferase involved in cell wall biosynthesis